VTPLVRLRILVLIALRSLWSHKVKNAIVGAIMMFGTFLVVTGSALLDSMEDSMARSITSSMSGHLQVYSDDAEDKLELFGSFGFGSTDIGEIDDFGKVEKSLLEVDNVAAVVPMGISIVTVFGGNDIDKALTDLRAAVREGDAEKTEVLAGRVRRIAENIQKDLDVLSKIARDQDKIEEDREVLARATSDEFWASFRTDPLPALDFLDSRVAPQAADGRLLYLRVIGTDLGRFTKTFDRFHVVKGEAVPDGRRGLLISDRTHEKLLKNLVARELDSIKEDLDEGATIAGDPLLQEKIGRNAKQYQRLLFQLDPEESSALEAALRAELPGEEGDLAALLQAFLRMDDSNFRARYDWFYREIAPRISLYDVNVGDVITLRSFTKSGYVKAVNVRVYGTYEFYGLEKSDLASASNLLDMITWRDLYGKMSADQVAELDAIKQSVGVKEISRESAEDALFGGGGEVEAAVEPATAAFDEFAGVELQDQAERQEALDTKVYSPEEIGDGLALNAAIVLRDAERLRETQKTIEERVAADDLGLQVVDWQQAAGLLGQFIVVMRAVLYVAIFVIFLVALVIINNSMVMATMERTPEIGTMRAIGAQRGFVMLLFLVETIVLGCIAGALGMAAGSAFVGWLGQVGIPAVADILVVLFAGPRLYPSVHPANLLFGFGTILVVSLLSTMYPAILAARVAPIVAMQGKE
jgi:ABC-type lipoprotein release transport system permease subunit